MTPSDDRLRDAALRALTPHGLEKTRQSPASQVGGEAATIQAGNGRFISFIGRNDWFHNPGDLFPAAVDIPMVARYARAAADLVLQLAERSDRVSRRAIPDDVAQRLALRHASQG